MWDDEIPADLLPALAMGYTRRKEFEARLLVRELARSMSADGRVPTPTKGPLKEGQVVVGATGKRAVFVSPDTFMAMMGQKQ